MPQCAPGTLPLWLPLAALIAAAGCSQAPREASPREQAIAAVEAGRWAAALEAIDRLIDAEPQDAQLWILRGRAMLGSGDAAGAKADLSEAIRLAPDRPEAYYFRGLALADLGERDAAREDRIRARQLDPAVEKAYLMAPAPTRSAPAARAAVADGPPSKAAGGAPSLAAASPATKDSEPVLGLVAPALAGERDELTEIGAADLAGGPVTPDVYFHGEDEATLTEQLLGLRLDAAPADVPLLWSLPFPTSPAHPPLALPAEPRGGKTPLPRLSPPLKSQVTGVVRPRPHSPSGALPADRRSAAADRRNGRFARLRSSDESARDELDRYEPARYGRRPPLVPHEPALPLPRPFDEQ